MMMELATNYNGMQSGITGFKWIAKMIEDFLN
jgi:hypothetical protein